MPCCGIVPETLTGIPDIVTAGAPGVMVCPPTTNWDALFAVMTWPSKFRVGRLPAGILIGVPAMVTAEAPGVIVCPPITYWEALLAVMIWPPTVKVGRLACFAP